MGEQASQSTVLYRELPMELPRTVPERALSLSPDRSHAPHAFSAASRVSASSHSK